MRSAVTRVSDISARCGALDSTSLRCLVSGSYFRRNQQLAASREITQVAKLYTQQYDNIRSGTIPTVAFELQSEGERPNLIDNGRNMGKLLRSRGAGECVMANITKLFNVTIECSCLQGTDWLLPTRVCFTLHCAIQRARTVDRVVTAAV